MDDEKERGGMRGTMLAREEPLIVPPIKVPKYNPFEAQYVEVSTKVLLSCLEDVLAPEILEYHSLAEILQMKDDKWLLRLAPDMIKRMNSKAG
jgi:hypothetical protein